MKTYILSDPKTDEELLRSEDITKLFRKTEDIYFELSLKDHDKFGSCSIHWWFEGDCWEGNLYDDENGQQTFLDPSFLITWIGDEFEIMESALRKFGISREGLQAAVERNKEA